MAQSIAKPTIIGLKDIDEARRVLGHEATALHDLGKSLDHSFVNALDLLENITGRIIVTGIGKSGHIAHKIAATLASTGSPAFFVHPAEASHGDLGMINKDDAVIALSNSGETTELSSIINYTRRYKIPLIAITSKSNSTLAKDSDCPLILPPVGEACPIGLAPTTSTTMMMALGDAIATCLLNRKGFSSSDFSSLHPGGSLGQKLQKVADIMHTGEKLPLASKETTMLDALVIMTGKSFGCLGIQDEDGKIIGIITDGDLRRHMGSNFIDRDVCDIMTRNPKFIHKDALVAEAINLMNEDRITSLFVSSNEDSGPFEPIGIIHIHDCLRVGTR